MKSTIFYALLYVFCSMALSAQAAVNTVDTTEDELNNDGDCSLREAVEASNTNIAVDNCIAGDSGVVDTIFFNITGDIVLDASLGPIVITEALGLDGFSRDTVIRQESSTQLFVVDMTITTDQVSFNNLTLRDGYAAPGSQGGAIELKEGGFFYFDNVAFINNTSEVGNSDPWGGGGAIFAGPLLNSFEPWLDIENSLFESNSVIDQAGNDDGFGGAIQSRFREDNGTPVNQPLDQITISQTEFNNNSAVRSGSAIYAADVTNVSLFETQLLGNLVTAASSAEASTIEVSGSTGFELFGLRSTTVTNNGAMTTTAGSTISMNNVRATIDNATFTGNEQTALDFSNQARGEILFSTLVSNGVQALSDSTIRICDSCIVALEASIVWNLWDTDAICDIDVNASYTSRGFNIDNDGSCTGHVDDLPMTDPGLVPLDAWGDNITTFDLFTFLPAGISLDASYIDDCPGPSGGILTRDARGETRPVDGSEIGMDLCDIGAVEYQFDIDAPVSRLTVLVDGSGAGSVTSVNFDNVDCTDSCTAYYSAFSQVRLNADPDPGSEFTGWSGACSGTGQCIVTMSLNRSVTATFSDVSGDVFFSSGFEN